MSSNRQHFREFRAHTLLKHGMLRRYIDAWIQILKRSHERLWVVDGFAGKGMDDKGNHGSPLHLALAAAKLSTEGASVRLIAVEKDRTWFKALKENLRPFDAENGGQAPVAYLREGRVQDWADEIFQMIAPGPAFFFLDPFGADGLELGLCKRVLALEKGEVFALFSHTAVVRHLAAVAKPVTVGAHQAQVQAQGTIFPEMSPTLLEEAVAQDEASEDGLEITKEAAERILLNLFGDPHEVEQLLATPRGDWGRAAVEAFAWALELAGASHITPIAIEDESAKEVYYLIHAAKSGRATTKMKAAYNAALNEVAAPKEEQENSLFPTERLRGAVAVGIEQIAAEVAYQFEGKTVEWGDDADWNSVVGFALGQTRMFTSQKAALKDRLSKTVPIAKKKPLTFSFPPRRAPGA